MELTPKSLVIFAADVEASAELLNLQPVSASPSDWSGSPQTHWAKMLSDERQSWGLQMECE